MAPKLDSILRPILFMFFLNNCYTNFYGPVNVNGEIITRAGSGPEVKTLNGILRGKWQVSRGTKEHEARKFSSFEGIPYANAIERFQSPEPPTDWKGIWDATAPGNVCPQLEKFNRKLCTNTENCLFANVYVPKLSFPQIFPTMVYIHGGSFTEGAGSFYDPKYMMEEDVILVTLNYRLGALGFLNTGDGRVPGNMGLKDIIMALKWVQANIVAFGGDPANVTIFGQSAGAAAVHILMLSPAAKGLFQKVILQSGSALCPFSFIERPKEVAATFARELNCTARTTGNDGNSVETVDVDCLNGKSVEEILAAQEKTNQATIASRFAPSLDSVDPNSWDFPVLPDTPRNLITNPSINSAGLPLIIGWNEQEGRFVAAKILFYPGTNSAKVLKENWIQGLASQFGLEKSLERESLTEVANEIRDFYFNDTVTLEKYPNLTDLLTDMAFLNGVKLTALLHATHNPHVFPYQLTFKGNFSLVNELGIPSNGPAHADDLQYFFPSRLEPKVQWPELVKGSADEEFSVKIISMWTSFARDGNPEGGSEKWSPISSKDSGNSTELSTKVSWFDLGRDFRSVPESQELANRFSFLDRIFTPKDEAVEADNEIITIETNLANSLFPGKQVFGFATLFQILMLIMC